MQYPEAKAHVLTGHVQQPALASGQQVKSPDQKAFQEFIARAAINTAKRVLLQQRAAAATMGDSKEGITSETTFSSTTAKDVC